MCAFLDRFGREWNYAPLPPDIPRGPEGECYVNARKLAVGSTLTYVEGDAALGGHAWCADSTGTVIDNTWPADILPPDRYFGVAFVPAAVFAVKIRLGTLDGVLWRIDYFYPWLMEDLHNLLDRRWHPSELVKVVEKEKK